MIEIIVTTKRYQNRRHRKRRIDKKWAKRYGFTEYEVQNKPFLYEGKLYVRQQDFEIINKVAQKQKGCPKWDMTLF